MRRLCHDRALPPHCGGARGAACNTSMRASVPHTTTSATTMTQRFGGHAARGDRRANAATCAPASPSHGVAGLGEPETMRAARPAHGDGIVCAPACAPGRAGHLCRWATRADARPHSHARAAPRKQGTCTFMLAGAAPMMCWQRCGIVHRHDNGSSCGARLSRVFGEHWTARPSGARPRHHCGSTPGLSGTPSARARPSRPAPPLAICKNRCV